MCRRNTSTASVNRAACSSRDTAAAEASSTREAFCCVTLSISEIAANLRYASTLFIRGGGDFLHDMCDTRDGINNSAHGFPCRCHLIRPGSINLTDSLIKPSISFAAWALRLASVRTSLATTANPRPCSPARAASTAAFSARIFVWKAILLMTAVIRKFSSNL